MRQCSYKLGWWSRQLQWNAFALYVVFGVILVDVVSDDAAKGLDDSGEFCTCGCHGTYGWVYICSMWYVGVQLGLIVARVTDVHTKWLGAQRRPG